MVTGAVPDQHRLHVGCESCRELGEKQIHDARVQPRRDQPFGLARRGQDINVSLLRLPHGTGSRTRFGPDASQRTLLAEPPLLANDGGPVWLSAVDAVNQMSA